jgi:hypothetical protein
MIEEIDYSEISNSELILDAIENTEFKGFKEDYLVIHYLLKKWKPNHIFEIGTNTGNGCRIMHNASPESKISTLDIIENCGQMCPKDVKKYFGDSMNFDFTNHYPIDCWFIDGNHVYQNVYHETKEALKSNPNYIIYHDADIQEVTDGILDAFNDSNKNTEYNLYRVINPPYIYSSSSKKITRILFAEKK